MLATLRRLGAHPRIEPYVAHALRSRAVSPSLPFLVGEVRGRGERDYVVRGNGVPVHVQHGTSDAATLDQAFLEGAYEPPAAVDAAIAALGRPPKVLDCGANVGMFTLWTAQRWPGASVLAVEPVPRNVASLRRNLALQGAGAASLDVLDAAAATADGTVSFSGGDFTRGHILEAGAAGAYEVASRDIFAFTAGVDLLKLDIEGGEWPILADPRFRAQGAAVVMLEYHPGGAPAGADPQESAKAALEAAGYRIESAVVEYAGAGILWGVRR